MRNNLGDEHANLTPSSFSVMQPFTKINNIRTEKKILSVCYAKMVHLKMKAKVLVKIKNLYTLCEG